MGFGKVWRVSPLFKKGNHNKRKERKEWIEEKLKKSAVS